MSAGTGGRREVVGVVDLLAPLGLGPIGRRLVDREMSHESVRRGTVPVPLPGRRVDRVAGPDLDDVAAARLHPPEAFGHEKRLADRVDVPRVPCAWRELDEARADAG